MTLKRTRQCKKATLFAIYRTSTSAQGTETLGHGGIQLLHAGDQLNVAAEQGFAVYSDTDYQISFFGMLLDGDQSSCYSLFSFLFCCFNGLME